MNTKRWQALIVLSVLQAVLVLDDGVVNVALPHIQRDLHFPAAFLAWANNTYALVFGSLLLAGGALADRYGRRRLFIVGASIFAVGSLVCVFAPTVAVFLGARIVQGLGAALASPAALGLVAANFPDMEERNKALGIWGIAAGVGGVLGMSLAGVAIGLTSWHWGFLINVPIVIVVVIAIRSLTPESSDPAVNRLDVMGSVLATAALAVLIAAVLNLGQNGADTTTVCLAAGGAALLILFVISQRRSGPTMIPRGFFNERNRSVGFIASFVMAGCFMAVFFALSLHFQNQWGWSPLRTGLALTLQPVVSFFAFPLAAKYTFSWGVKHTLPLGLLVCSIGLFLLSNISPGHHYWPVVAPGLACLGVGTAFAFVSATAAAFGGNDEAAGLASAVIDAAQQMGAAVGLAALVAVAVGASTSGQAAFGTAFLVGAGVLVLLAAVTFATLQKSEGFEPAGEFG